MAQGTWMDCPLCRRAFLLNVNFRNVRISGGRINMAIRCPHCGSDFDAAGEGEVTVSTSRTGRLHVVRDLRTAARRALAEAPSVEELTALVESLREAVDGATTVEEAVARVQSFPRLEAWVKANPTTARMIGTLLLVVLTALTTRVVSPDPAPAPTPHVDVHVRQPSDEELQQIIEDAIRQAEKDQSSGGAAHSPG